MARTWRPKTELTLSDEEWAALKGWVRRRSTPQAWALRRRIFLACARGVSIKDVAAQLGSTPKNATHWSTRSMAKELGLSQSAVSRIWRAFGLQPHRSETSLLSTDPYRSTRCWTTTPPTRPRPSGPGC